MVEAIMFHDFHRSQPPVSVESSSTSEHWLLELESFGRFAIPSNHQRTASFPNSLRRYTQNKKKTLRNSFSEGIERFCRFRLPAKVIDLLKYQCEYRVKILALIHEGRMRPLEIPSGASKHGPTRPSSYLTDQVFLNGSSRRNVVVVAAQRRHK